MHENRETCGASVQQTDRSAKAESRTADVYALQESDRCIVPMKLLNIEGNPSTEAAEGRRRPKENDAQSNTSPTQSGERVSKDWAACAGWRRRGKESGSRLCCIM